MRDDVADPMTNSPLLSVLWTGNNLGRDTSGVARPLTVLKNTIYIKTEFKQGNAAEILKRFLAKSFRKSLLSGKIYIFFSSSSIICAGVKDKLPLCDNNFYQ